MDCQRTEVSAEVNTVYGLKLISQAGNPKHLAETFKIKDISKSCFNITDQTVKDHLWFWSWTFVALMSSNINTVRCGGARVLRVLQSLGQDSVGRPHHLHRVPAEQSPFIVDQLSPETSVGSDEGSLLQNLLVSLTEAEAFKPADTETRTKNQRDQNHLCVQNHL